MCKGWIAQGSAALWRLCTKCVKRTPISERTPRRCHLLELPVELRLQIWDFVYSTTYLLHITVDTETVYINPHLYYDPPWTPARNIPALLRTCKLVNEEASPALYASTKFLVDIYGKPAENTLKSAAFEIQDLAFLKRAARIEELDIFQSDDVAAVTIAQSLQAFISMLSSGKPVALTTFEVYLTKEPPENMDQVFRALLDWNCGPSLYTVYFDDGGAHSGKLRLDMSPTGDLRTALLQAESDLLRAQDCLKEAKEDHEIANNITIAKHHILKKFHSYSTSGDRYREASRSFQVAADDTDDAEARVRSAQFKVDTAFTKIRANEKELKQYTVADGWREERQNRESSRPQRESKREKSRREKMQEDEEWAKREQDLQDQANRKRREQEQYAERRREDEDWVRRKEEAIRDDQKTQWDNWQAHQRRQAEWYEWKRRQQAEDRQRQQRPSDSTSGKHPTQEYSRTNGITKDSIEAFHQAVKDALQDRSTVRCFPQPPYEPCSKPGCILTAKTRVLKACDCNIKTVFASRPKLKADRVQYHPDWWAKVPDDVREEIQRAASEIFTVINGMLAR
ncbi:hypothetical protein LTR10_006282 [Elasticomyces elasticus]|nr:hypothetical protein LTR10_006282 [Elasticomyces elasticus]